MKNYALEDLISQVHKNKSVNYTFDLSYHKIIWLSDDIFRIKNYESPIVMGRKSKGGRRKKFLDWSGDDVEINLENRKSTELKIIKTIYGLANKNFTCGDRFITFTPAERILDVKIANKYWDRFIKRMKRRYGDFKYLAVIQFQDEKADNHRVHYHVLMNLDFIEWKDLLQIWGKGKGSVWITDIYHVDNLGAYLLHYMGKTVGDARLYGNKAYLCSKGLKRPEEKNLTDDEYSEIEKKFDLINRKPAVKKGYSTENYGWVDEMEFNLKRGLI